MTLHDISPPLSPALSVWPGDTPLAREVLLDVRAGDNVTLSTLHATVHLGAHADAPSHYAAEAPAIEGVPLDLYWGPCQVVRVGAAPGRRVMPSDLRTELRAERVLVATGTYPDPRIFNEDFAALSPELIVDLAERGVRLVGIDTPSVDPFASQTLETHHACLERGVAVLEGLDLRDVPAGLYELVALPLRLVGFDASPIRAVLRSG